MQPSAPLPPHRRRGASIAGPTILIGVGLVLLLQNLGVLPHNAWSNLWRLWPLALVLGGLELLAGGRLRGPQLAGVVVLTTLAGVSALAAVSQVPPTARAAIGVDSTQLLEGATEAQVRISFGAGRLEVGALSDTQTGQLAATSFAGPAALQPRTSYRVRNGVGDLRYDPPRESHGFPFFTFGRSGLEPPQLVVGLTPAIPISLEVKTGAATGQIDLSKLRVTRFDLETGASTNTIRLPESAGQTAIRVEGGAATITIEIPRDVAAQIRFEGGISTLEVDQSRFPSVGSGRYRSVNYESAANRADILIETGAATVNVR